MKLTHFNPIIMYDLCYVIIIYVISSNIHLVEHVVQWIPSHME